jgi:hypothetical protein
MRRRKGWRQKPRRQLNGRRRHARAGLAPLCPLATARAWQPAGQRTMQAAAGSCQLAGREAAAVAGPQGEGGAAAEAGGASLLQRRCTTGWAAAWSC